MGYLRIRGDRGTLFPKDRCIVSFDGTHIAYDVRGRGSGGLKKSPSGEQATGPVVVLCAGYVCSDNFWVYLAPELEKRARVLIWNYRGAGVSGMPREPGFWSRGLTADDFAVENYAKDLKTILDHEGIDDVVLLGHSMGVQVCLEAYRLFPERVRAIVSITGPYASPIRTFYNFAHSARLFSVARLAFSAFPRPAHRLWRRLFQTSLPHALARRAGAIGELCRAEDMAPYYEHMAELDPVIMMRMAEAMHRHSAEDLLRKIKAPTLVVVGDKDNFTPPWLGRVMASRIPVAEQLVVPGGTHASIIEQPALINGVVLDFLARHAGIGGAAAPRVRPAKPRQRPAKTSGMMEA